MHRTYILDNQEVKEFNKKYNTNFYSIMVKQENTKFYAILDCDLKVKLYRKEALSYFNKDNANILNAS